jgi:NAD kinase
MNRKLVVIHRRTRLQELVYRYNSVDQARYYVESLGEDFGDYELEDKKHQLAVKNVKELLTLLNLRFHFVERRYLANYLFGEDDLVLVLGQDGLVANTLKYLSGQAVIGVNPDQDRWEGRLLPFSVKDLQRVLPECLNDQRSCLEVTMAEARLNDGQVLKAVNDFFIGVKNHGSFRYSLCAGGVEERQSSSGVLVSAPLGGTAWLRSVLTGAQQIMEHFVDMPKLNLELFKTCSEKKLIYSVREPFPSLYSKVEHCFGEIKGTKKLVLKSETPYNAVIFSDGIQEDFLEFGAGMVAEISVSDTRGLLVK